MKHQWLAYVIVGLLSIGAGVAIAGLPNNVPVDATIVPPTTTEAPAPTLPETTVPTTTEPETTEPEATAPETTEAEDIATTTSEPVDSVPAELADRADLQVAAANGANVEGAALRVATRLEEVGYVEVATLNGSEIVEFTTVHFAEGFDEAALRLAEDLDLLADFVAPLADAPNVADLPDTVELLVYVGRDRA